MEMLYSMKSVITIMKFEVELENGFKQRFNNVEIFSDTSMVLYVRGTNFYTQMFRLKTNIQTIVFTKLMFYSQDTSTLTNSRW